MPGRAIKSADSPVRLVSDDFGRLLVAGDTRIAIAPRKHAPFAVDAVVREEDTHLLLTADTMIRQPRQSIDELLGEAARTPPSRPGSVVLRQGPPLQLLAVIYDIEREPMWQEKWIDEALAAVFDIVERQHITALGLPLLGTGHGSMHPARVAHLLARALGRSSPASLQRLWVQASDTAAEQARTLLANRFHR